MDYCFVRRENETETVPILVVKDRGSRAIQAWMVERKGADVDTGDAASRAVQGIRSFGHRGRLMIKTDNEPAILALKEEIMRSFPDGVIPVESPPHESESNGAAENGVKLVKGLLRVHLLALERKIGGSVPSKHPMMAWLIECVADIATKYLQGADGRTAYERLFGKQVHEEALEFGERVLWRKRRTQDMNVVLDARWAEGIWLGRRWGTISHRVAIGNEVIEVRAVQRRPLPERWSKEALEQIRAVPWRNPAPPIAEAPMVVLPPLPADDRPLVPARAVEAALRRVHSTGGP